MYPWTPHEALGKKKITSLIGTPFYLSLFLLSEEITILNL